MKFFGSPHDYGTVSALPAADWSEFLQMRLEAPHHLDVSRATYRSMTPDERKRLKHVAYFTPAAFRSSPSPRKRECVTHAALVCLDVDDSAHAQPLLDQIRLSGPGGLLPWAYAVYHTASSTPEAPRLRVVVPCDPIAAPSYPRAVALLAHTLGLPAVTPESLKIEQAMFVPTVFIGDDETGFDPMVDRLRDGPQMRSADITADFSVKTASGAPSAEKAFKTDLAGLDDASALLYLSAPLEGITPKSAALALEKLDPDCPRDKWVKIMCAIQHQFGDGTDAFNLFDAWSAKGAKYPGSEDCLKEWRTRRPNASGRASYTFRSVIHEARQLGFDLSADEAQTALLNLLEWIKSKARTVSELLYQVAPKFAALPRRAAAEEDAVLSAVGPALRRLGVSVTRPALRKGMAALNRAEARMFKDKPATPEAKLPAWARGVCFVGSACEFFDRKTQQRRKPEALDLELSMHFTEEGSSVPSDRPRDYLLNQVRIPRVGDYIYLPSSAEPYPEHPRQAGLLMVNTYKPDHPEGAPARAAEAGAVLLRHLSLLIAEEDYRALLLSWMAYHVQAPGAKIRWAPLLQGAQGCGKSALVEALRVVLGNSNVRVVSGTNIVGTTFTEWMEGAQVVAIEEIRVAGHNRVDVMNMLKPAITNDSISVTRKHRDMREVHNVANYFLLTNHHDALAVTGDDRRYFVLESRIQTSAQVKAEMPQEHFAELFDTLGHNAAGLRAFLQEYPLHPQFDPNGHAPKTVYLDRLQDMTAPPLESAVAQILACEDPLLCREFTRFDLLMQKVRAEHSVEYLSDKSLSLALRAAGLYKVGRVRVGEARVTVWGCEALEDATKEHDERLAYRALMGFGEENAIS